MTQPDSIALEDAWIWVEAERVERQGYTDLIELDECLQAFYENRLDNVEDLTRLWMPLEQLIPGKRLLSQLDSDTMRHCLYQLSELERSAIAHRYEPDCPELLQTMANYFVRSQSPNFAHFCNEAYTNGLVALAIRIYAIL